MKNIITATATVAALLAGSAAMAQGYVDQNGFITAGTHLDLGTVHVNENATQTIAEMPTEHAGNKQVAVTLFVTDSAAAKDATQGR